MEINPGSRIQHVMLQNEIVANEPSKIEAACRPLTDVLSEGPTSRKESCYCIFSVISSLALLDKKQQELPMSKNHLILS